MAIPRVLIKARERVSRAVADSVAFDQALSHLAELDIVLPHAVERLMLDLGRERTLADRRRFNANLDRRRAEGLVGGAR